LAWTEDRKEVGYQTIRGQEIRVSGYQKTDDRGQRTDLVIKLQVFGR